MREMLTVRVLPQVLLLLPIGVGAFDGSLHVVYVDDLTGGRLKVHTGGEVHVVHWHGVGLLGRGIVLVDGLVEGVHKQHKLSLRHYCKEKSAAFNVKH